MDVKSQVLFGYIIIGIFLIVFNKQICLSYINYVKAHNSFFRHINKYFIFRIDKKNEKNFVIYIRLFTISFGFLTIVFGAYI